MSENDWYFNIGDRVRVVDGYGTRLARGSEHTITGRDGDYVSVTSDGQPTWSPWRFEKIETKKPKFKAGDVVTYPENADVRFTIKGVKTDLTFTSDEIAYDYSDIKGWDWESSLALAPPTTTPHIVARVENGKPRPSTVPFIHDGRDAAVKEADRLAVLNPGTEFAVYEKVAARVADVPVAREAA